MKKGWKRLTAVLASCLMASATIATLSSCNATNEGSASYTYRTYTSVMPSNWNELTYSDNNDTQILNYIVSPFFEFDYKFDEAKGGKFNDDGSINVDAIVPGGYEVKYSAAVNLEDVTSSVDEKWGYTDEQKANGSYAWKITLRDDLKWDDGTPIDAYDFVYTMEQQLDPAFQNMRASTYYNNIQIKGAKKRVYSGTSGHGAGFTFGVDYETNKGTMTFSWTDGYYCDYYKSYGYSPAELIMAFGGFDGLDSADDAQAFLDAWEGKSVADCLADDGLMKTFLDVFFMEVDREDWTEEEYDSLLYTFNCDYVNEEFAFENVGYYAPSKYELVVCLDVPIAALNEDGTFTYEAAYSFSSMPLVKKDLYEKCKIAPQEGSTLWTSNYNSSYATCASWGPYKLKAFQSGKYYTLEKNDNWYGYKMADNKNQYKVDQINCEKIATVATAWMKFLSGEIDDVGLDVDHKADYRGSKYTLYTPGTGTFGTNIYANLDVLRTAGRNNGVLAIDDFRKAMALYLDRDDFNSTCYTAHRSCYGLMGPSYYYDVDNGGVYRDHQIAKEGLLRVYGFTQNDDETWTDGVNTYADYEEAYSAMNGMNRPLAKQLLESAYKELTDNAQKYNYDPSKPIEIKYGTSEDNENTRRSYNYYVKFFEDLTKGTSFEGKINCTFDGSFGSKWSDDFKAGSYDLAVGTGFNGGAFDPEGFLQCYIDPNAGLMYSTWWDTEREMLTFTMPDGDYDGAGEELTMSVFNWYCCLNGIAESEGQSEKYNWGAGFAPSEARMTLCAKLEEVVISKYYTILTTSQNSATVNGAKFLNLCEDYNMFMGFGGMRYLIPQYNDAEWNAFVKANNNDLSTEYKKSE